MFLALNIGNIFKMICSHVIKGNMDNIWVVVCICDGISMEQYYKNKINIFKPKYGWLVKNIYHSY